MRDGLGEGAALCGEEDDGLFGCVALWFGGDVEGLKAVVDGLGLEDHALAAAEWPVVYGAVTVFSKRAKIMRSNVDEVGGDGALEDAVVERRGEECGKDGEDVEAHKNRVQGSGPRDQPTGARGGVEAALLRYGWKGLSLHDRWRLSGAFDFANHSKSVTCEVRITVHSEESRSRILG